MIALGLGLAILLGSGLVALVLYRAPRLSSAIGAAGAVAGCALGLLPAVQGLAGRPAADVAREWPVPAGAFVAGIDPLSAFFLVPLFILSGVAAVYGRQYLLAYAPRKSLGPPSFFYNLMVASMAGVVVARDGVLFLVAWELMTLSSYALISFEHEDPAVKRAGWVYLIAAHISVACLFAMFLLLGRESGRFEFTALSAGGATPTIVFLLALVAFGIKAGFVPLHVWLPEAHAAAPSHVSALMSGVLIKLGIYGILRVTTFLPSAAWWGPALIVVGLGGALLGISLAMYQRDLKRVLAYSSIENVGLIVTGLGLGLWGLSRGDGRLAALGLLAGLLHLWNHTLMKGLMFLAAGSVLHGAGTKDLERLGGLMKRMPTTGLLMALGAIAIAGLPPLNGFVSEWLLYLGLMAGGGGAQAGAGVTGTLVLLGVGLLAFVGGLAVLCFVRLVGVALLGQPRSAAAEHAHESSAWMTGPMWLLALAAGGAAMFPDRLLGALAPVAAQLGAPVAALASVAASTRPLGVAAVVIWVALIGLGLSLARMIRRRSVELEPTWGCGYLAPTPRMQYTGRSFIEMMAARLLPPLFRARINIESPQGLFPRPGELSTDSRDPFTRGVYEPFLERWAERFARLRWLQQGVLQVYILYILVVVVVALGWMSARAWTPNAATPSALIRKLSE